MSPILPRIQRASPQYLRAAREFAIVTGVYGAYLLARNLLVPDAENLAMSNALRVVSLEQRLGIFSETQ
jgi:hypothetical protein